jgi:cytochrome c biogenesis protein CcdA
MDDLNNVFDELDELTEAAHEGLLAWKVVLFALGFSMLFYGTAMPSLLLYTKYPQYKPLFIAALIFDGLALILIFGFRWYRRTTARLGTQNTSQLP